MSIRIGYDAKRIFHNRTGLGNFGRSLIDLLAKHLPQNTYVLLNPKQSKLDYPLPNKHVIERQPRGWWWKSFSSIWRQGPVCRDVLQEKIQLFHGLSGELPRGLKIPAVVSVHDLIFIKHPKLYSPIDVWIHRAKVKHAVQAADKVVAISQETKNDLITLLQVPASKIEVVYQGCHSQFHKQVPRAEIDRILKKYKLPEKFILSVGTLQKRKNTGLILNALKHTRDAIVLVGKRTVYVEELQSIIQKNGMEQRVILIHEIAFSELPALYQAADIFCYPSFSEGFGIPILEALCSGTPVITSQGGCMEEAGGPKSLYVDPSQPDELLNAVQKLQSNSSFREQIVQEGLAHSKNFTEDKIAAQWQKIYQSIL